MRTKAFLPVFAAALLSACATTDKAEMASATPAKTKPQSAANPFEVDWDYVRRVERVAAHRGVQVKWVQPPRIQDRRGDDPR